MEVSYVPEDKSKETPTIKDLVSQKRPMFSYEKEARIVLIKDYSNPNYPDRITLGAGVEWDPELHLEGIWVHPDSQYWFIEIVSETVRRLAPKLSGNGDPKVFYSKMNTYPPF